MQYLFEYEAANINHSKKIYLLNHCSDQKNLTAQTVTCKPRTSASLSSQFPSIQLRFR
jgi:hypothetical protein